MHGQKFTFTMPLELYVEQYGWEAIGRAIVITNRGRALGLGQVPKKNQQNSLMKFKGYFMYFYSALNELF